VDKKVIIYIGGFELPDKNAAANRVMNNAKIMRDIGYHVVLVGVSADCDVCIENTKAVYDGFECWSLRYDSPGDRFKKQMDISLYSAVLERYGDISALILYNYPAIGLYRFKRYCNKNNISLVVDCTEWYGMPYGNLLVKVIKWADIYTRMMILHKKTDGIICISRYLQNYYQKHTKTVYVPALIDSKDQQWQKNKTEDGSCTRLVYSGSPGRQKDKINKIIEGLYALKEYDFLFQVVGISKKEYLKYYEEHTDIIEELAGKVTFLGRVTHETALEYVKNADFTIFFRDKTRVSMAGFPTKFVESISAKTPVITNMTSNLTDYLIDGVNGFFVEKHQDITHTLEMVFSLDKEAIAKMHKNCNAELFDYRNYIAGVEVFLGDILNGKE